jgi:hypothetical protein
VARTVACPAARAVSVAGADGDWNAATAASLEDHDACAVTSCVDPSS